MDKILILEQRAERIAEFRKWLEPNYKLTFADSVRNAVDLANKESFALYISALFLPRTESASESVFDFVRATKSQDKTKKVPFYFCCIRPSTMMQSMADALQTTAKATGAEYFELVHSSDLSNLPKKVSSAIAGRQTV